MTTTHATPKGSLVWVGTAPGLQLARTQVWEAASTHLPVLVLGEPGTVVGRSFRSSGGPCGGLSAVSVPAIAAFSGS